MCHITCFETHRDSAEGLTLLGFNDLQHPRLHNLVLDSTQLHSTPLHSNHLDSSIENRPCRRIRFLGRILDQIASRHSFLDHRRGSSQISRSFLSTPQQHLRSGGLSQHVRVSAIWTDMYVLRTERRHVSGAASAPRDKYWSDKNQSCSTNSLRNHPMVGRYFPIRPAVRSLSSCGTVGFVRVNPDTSGYVRIVSNKVPRRPFNHCGRLVLRGSSINSSSVASSSSVVVSSSCSGGLS
ncbi:predicted protein [Arabidopsis lyrata subsp. lyrata]|uniref:Predicted protein n=1 Tax=Arabidopsis lyrata subsp. lyrata TaxID=81972 RepID=D7KPV5_ARALL|nr:predicted protein [Arabidopsis lyrata subsp. lyrata]